MAVFRLQENVPDVYQRKSRDFQLFCNVFDYMNGAVKYDIDSIRDIIDTNQCNERLLPYLQTKLGFFTNVKISAEDLRIILKAFPYIVRNKGSRIGIEQAIQVFLKIYGLSANVEVRIDNGDEISGDYVIYIGVQDKLPDTTILNEILKYVIPAGYGLRFVFYADTSYKLPIYQKDFINIVIAKSSIDSGVRPSTDTEYPSIIDNVDTTLVAGAEVRAEDPQEGNGDLSSGGNYSELKRLD